MKKIYIAGSGGMLGEAFYSQFKNDYTLKCTDKDVNEDWISYLDFRNCETYKKDVEAFKPDYLFHLGLSKKFLLSRFSKFYFSTMNFNDC